MEINVTPTNFINDLLNTVDSVTEEFVANGYRALAEHWLTSGLLTSVLTLYIVHFFYQVQFHDTPIKDMVTHLVKVCFIFTLATNWDVFFLLIYQVLTNEPTTISNLLVAKISGTDGSLNDVFVNGMKKSMQLIMSFSWSKIMILRFLSGLLLSLATCLFTLPAIILVIIAKFYLAFLLALSPYFLFAYLFNATRGLMESWIKAMLNKALIPVFVGAVLLLSSSLAEVCLTKPISSDELNFSHIAIYFVGSVISLVLCWLIPTQTASLTASFAMPGMGQTLSHAKEALMPAKYAGRFVRGAATRGMKGIKQAKQGYDTRQQRLLTEIKERDNQRRQTQQRAREATLAKQVAKERNYNV